MKYQELEKFKNCPYCNSENLQIILHAPDRITGIPGTFSLSRCENCKLVFQSPRISEEEHLLLNEPFVETQYALSQKKKTVKLSGFKRFKKFLYTQTLINHFRYTNFGKKNTLLAIATFPIKRLLRVELIPYYVKGGTLLEVGCSEGAYLSTLRNNGWDVYGVEVDRESVEKARRKHNLNVQNTKIEDVHFEENKFDVIIMSMVVEHLRNPFSALEKITTYLKPGGQLIFSIPYFEGLEFQFFREYSYGLQLPHHMTFLNKRIIKDYLAKIGYSNIQMYFQYQVRDVVASSYYKYEDTKKPAYKFIAHNKLIRKTLIKPLVFLSSLLQKTSRVTVYARKN